MRTISLNGEWTLTRLAKGETLAARVPGCVHMDLMAAGRLPALDYRDQEDLHQWPVDEDWGYHRTFELTAVKMIRDLIDSFESGVYEVVSRGIERGDDIQAVERRLRELQLAKER